MLYKILKSERVSERNKQRIKLKDFGYLGLVCFLEDVPVTMTTVRCLYEQVLATGNARSGGNVERNKKNELFNVKAPGNLFSNLGFKKSSTFRVLSFIRTNKSTPVPGSYSNYKSDSVSLNMCFCIPEVTASLL